MTPGSGLEERLRSILRAHISEILVRPILALSITRAQVDLSRPRAGDSKRLLCELEPAVRLYVADAERRDSCVRQLTEALQSGAAAGASTEATWVVPIGQEEDIVIARMRGADVCRDLGFTLATQIKLATVISELARNIVQYAGRGEIRLSRVDKPPGVEVVASDHGPGITDVQRVLSPSYRSKTGMGVGLRGSRNLVDAFEVRSSPGQGTEVRVRKNL